MYRFYLWRSQNFQDHLSIHTRRAHRPMSIFFSFSSYFCREYLLWSIVVWLLLFFDLSPWLSEVINPWEENLAYASAGNRAQFWEASLALRLRSKSYLPQQMASQMQLLHTDWEQIAFFSYPVSLSCYFSSSQILAMLSMEFLDHLYTNI